MNVQDRGQKQDEAEVRQLMSERETAMRAGNAEFLVSRYTPEAVKFDLAPPLRHTGPEVHDAAGLRSWFAGFAGPVEYDIRDLVVTAGDEVAFCHSLNRLSATPRRGSESFELWFRATVCLRKVEGTWRIAHEHTSTPFYMDGSFKAAVDLAP